MPATSTTSTAIPDAARLEEMLRDHYDLEVNGFEPLAGETDDTVRVRTAAGSVVAKRCSLDRLTQVEAEILVLDQLSEALPAIATPDLVRTRDGQPLVIDEHDGVLLRVLSWIRGQPWHEMPRPPARLRGDLGALAAATVQALSGLPPGPFTRTHPWDLRRCGATVADALTDRADTDAALLRQVSEHAQAELDRCADRLPRAVLHHDLNDHNVLVTRDREGCWRISGVVDVGDVLHTHRVCETAIAAAYAMLRSPDPIAAATEVVTGFHRQVPLTDDELAVVLPLAAARLAMNAATWSHRRAHGITPQYAATRMRHTLATLRGLAAIPPAVAEARLHLALGRTPTPTRLAAPTATLLKAMAVQVVDLSPTGDTPVGQITVPDETLLLGRHLEPRASRAGRCSLDHPPATVHLGIDVFASAGTSVTAPWPGSVEQYGGVLLLHSAGHPILLLDGLAATVDGGQRVETGSPLGVITGRPCEPDAPPHLHAQLSATPAPPRFVSAEQAPGWEVCSPDPSVLLGINSAGATWDDPTTDVLQGRAAHLASSQRSYYRDPMVLASADGVWFTDSHARRYLDAVNNVTHLGHGHPAVVDAVHRQMRRLNTNSRFVYPELSRYAARLAALLPDPLEVVFAVCTGSEANDLALRMARTVTGREHVVVIDGAYHGNTTAVTAASPNRYSGPGGTGRPPTTLEVPTPDRYRGRYGYDDPNAGAKYAAEAVTIITAACLRGEAPAAVMAESLMGTAGQIVHPPGYLTGLYAEARRVGALCIADEVQVGFGRLGRVKWGFELGEVTPDIVTVGKPIGNGYPLAAVITTRAIADAFDTGMKYFNTFGGNPVACAAGDAVLDVLADGTLRAHAASVGTRLRTQLQSLAERHPLIGDVRGEGLYLGVELVSDPDRKTPAVAAAYAISERLKEDGIVVWPNGIHDNVLKIKPPMVFDETHADLLVDTLDIALAEGW